MKMLSIGIDDKKIQEDLTALALKKYRETGERMLHSYFAQKNAHGHPFAQEDGEGTAFVRNIIEGLLLDDNINAKVKRHVETHWEKILEEACIEAMKHKARALAFNAEGIRTPKAGSALDQ